MKPAIIARGKCLRLSPGPRIARCQSREVADLLALYARSHALLAALSTPIDPLAALARSSITLQIAALEESLLQPVTLKPLDLSLD